MPALRILTAQDLRASLTMREAVPLMGDAFGALAEGRAVVPGRSGFEMPEGEGRALLMPVYLPAQEQFGVKIVSLFSGNPAKGLPYIHALMMLADAATGAPLALMDGAFLTALRTGAASGLATDLLARKDAATVMIFGAGAQSRFQLEGVCAVRDVRSACVYDTHRGRAEAFVREMSVSVPCPVSVADSPAAAAGADIICTATTSTAPVMAAEDVRDGTHINAIGAYRPEMCELPPRTLVRSLLVVDARASVTAEAGDILRAIREEGYSLSSIHAELGEIVTRKKPGRTSAAEVTIFKSVGNASQDLVAAGRALANAARLGLGTVVEL